jgi:hypothetical protein
MIAAEMFDRLLNDCQWSQPHADRQNNIHAHIP